MQIIDFELDSIEQLGEAVDLTSDGDDMREDFALYFVMNLPKKTINMDNLDPLHDQIKRDKKSRNDKIIAENTSKKLKAQESIEMH